MWVCPGLYVYACINEWMYASVYGLSARVSVCVSECWLKLHLVEAIAHGQSSWEYECKGDKEKLLFKDRAYGICELFGNYLEFNCE